MKRTLRQGAVNKTARRLRKQLTKPELWLWLRLKERTGDLVFRNQHPIGTYVLDFYCPKAKLCIEVDGEIHTRDYQRAHDEKRDQWLTEQGIYVHRINAVDLLADPDETANGVVNLALGRWLALQDAPPTAFGGPPSP
ncbi:MULTISPECIES: endonuclease domain-containing protein [Asticcacaulis]|uniref:endonuclease domain-containing protein n=1 Tax=Asticcacaulis TaxID=76890 RepID=UPI001AE3F296|nr:MULTISPECIES: endonuclease domain-containing protein [Asticcacaulis]MBP2158115.1 very-short-patch-repair endonuclease [Asticcacaulis solisilvae]MDR6799160.1 very-short-patch-repair endonuclease [Asticcacaulis sp. BE141]